MLPVLLFLQGRWMVPHPQAIWMQRAQSELLIVFANLLDSQYSEFNTFGGGSSACCWCRCFSICAGGSIPRPLGCSKRDRNRRGTAIRQLRGKCGSVLQRPIVWRNCEAVRQRGCSLRETLQSDKRTPSPAKGAELPRSETCESYEVQNFSNHNCFVKRSLLLLISLQLLTLAGRIRIGSFQFLTRLPTPSSADLIGRSCLLTCAFQYRCQGG